MPISETLQRELDYYEQVYYALDEPIPFKDDLKIYPILIKDYYKFYNCFGCITMDKNVINGTDEYGRQIKISNIKGLGQNYLEYLVDQMSSEGFGPILTQQLMELLELTFHISKCMYCPECGEKVSYQTMFENLDSFVQEELKNAQQMYQEAMEAKNEGEVPPMPKELIDLITLQAKSEYVQNKLLCPKCSSKMRDIFSIKKNNGFVSLMVQNTELTPSDFDKYKAIVPRQNILDYDGDKYIDPELKEELELKAQMQNKDYTSPTLEKQLICVAISTGYTLDYLQEITMRKLSMMLRLIDKKNTYYAQLQASMSGMVTFKEDPKHWIFSDDKRNIKDELTSLDNFEKKFEQVV